MKYLTFATIFGFMGLESKKNFVKQEVGRKLGGENNGTLCFACLHCLMQWISRLAKAFLL